jgi:hypothetical protein
VITTWRKLPNGVLAPDDQGTVEWVGKLKTGDGVMGEFKRPRNYAFMKKWFALVNYAFEMWEPPEDAPEKNFDRFREEMTMLAGYYQEVPSVKGGTRIQARSISFASMDEDTFADLYDKTILAILKWVLKTYKRSDIDRVMSEVAKFG